MERDIPPTPGELEAHAGTTLVVIVNFDGGPGLLECIASVIAQSSPVSIVVVDNGSTDGSDLQVTRRFPEVTVCHAPRNLGFGEAVNVAVSTHGGDTILVLNPDIVLRDGCLPAMLTTLGAREGAVGPVLEVAASGSAEAGMTINHTGMPTLQTGDRAPLYVPGCALVTTRRVFEQVGGFDGRYFLFVEDVEFCWRVLLAGFDVSVARDANADHEGGGSVAGGYLRPGSPYVTSEARVALRERNSIALMISCAPWWWLPVVVPLQMGRSAAVAAGAVAMGRPGLSWSIVRGVGWNLRELPASLRRRQTLAPSPAGSRSARARLTTGPLLVRTVRSYGLPRIVGRSVPAYRGTGPSPGEEVS
jgi:N-acetylglucosaminyl-diphospho-decaprenol L-rhamnosyltransferase